MNLTFPQNKKKGEKKDGKSRKQIFEIQMKCKDTGSLEQNRSKRQLLANALPNTRPRSKTNTDKKKKTAGKAMYKISKINTIFIIDMLQKKVP